MRVKLENPILLSKAIELISELVVEVRIKVTEFGFSITAIDPANVAMVGFKLPKSAFTSFELSENKSEVLGVNLESLKKILKRASSSSSVILENKDEGTLEINIDDRVRRKFELSLIEIESEDKEMPSLDYSSKIEINSGDLIASVEDCSVVSDACTFSVKNKNFIIEAKGLNSARTEYSGDEVRIEGEDCKSRYSLEYLSKFMKASKMCDKTMLKFANDHPLRMDIKTEIFELGFILAPRVEVDD
jgi:proliferating cell nuclear antigen PCNA